MGKRRVPAKLSKRECKCLHASVEEFDLEQSIGDGVRLPDELVKTLVGNGPIALIISVTSMGDSWRLPINQYPKPHRFPERGWTHDYMQVAGVESIDDPAVGFVQRDDRSSDSPVASKGPFIQVQSPRQSVSVGSIQYCAAWRREVVRTVSANVVLSGLEIAPIGCDFRSSGVDGDKVGPYIVCAGLGQQLLNDRLGCYRD